METMIQSRYGKSESKRRLTLLFGGATLQISCPLGTKERRAKQMVTYAELFQFCIFIVALVGLCYTVFKGRK